MHFSKKIRRLRRVWLAFSSKLKNRKSKGGGEGISSGGGGGGESESGDNFSVSGSLVNLEDDVQTCEYKDVQVMWNLLNRHKLEQAEVAVTQFANRNESSIQCSITV